MAYATIGDMTVRFGAQEMIRVTTPADQELDGIVHRTAQAALDDASALIDSYVGRRYLVPMDLPPPMVVTHCCNIARYSLATGDGKTTSADVRDRYKDAEAWLAKVSLGQVVLELDEIATSDESHAKASERGREDAPFGRGPFG